MDIDPKALERIQELEALLEDRMVVIDLQQEELNELRAHNKVLRGQIALLRQDRRYEVVSL